MVHVKSVILLGLAIFTGGVLSHGMVTSFKTDGVSNKGFILDYYYAKINKQLVPDIAGWYAENLDSGFVAPDAYSTPDINCHKNALPGTLSATVAAGGTVEFQWKPVWPHQYGPVFTYVAKCAGDCSSVDKTTLKWVKIDEEGINNVTQQWASGKLIQNNGSWNTTVPPSLAPGNYVFRHEIIALHGAIAPNGAQNYPQCFNINVTGSGTANPVGTLGTELYKKTDPGIVINVYRTISDYPMPGPALWRG